MARRPDFSKKVLSKQELAELAKRFKAMSPMAVMDMYNAAYHGCKLDDEHNVPKARHIQELVTAWKEMRSWSKKR